MFLLSVKSNNKFIIRHWEYSNQPHSKVSVTINCFNFMTINGLNR